jgi:NitT/TauT family transport system substrate-binding protein
MARAVLAEAGLKPEDAQFISQGTAGRFPGLVTGQLDGVVLHPEDFFLAQRQRGDIHVLSVLAEKLPHTPSGAYGAADALVARDRATVVGVVAAMVEANRTLHLARTQKEVEGAVDQHAHGELIHRRRIDRCGARHLDA